MKDLLRIACVQYPQRRIGGFAEFAAQVAEQVRIAADYGSQFVLFPELFTLQLLSAERPLLDAEASIDVLGGHSARLQQLFSDLARRHAIDVIGGSHIERGTDGVARNLCYIALRDGSLHVRPKLHPTPNERDWWGIEGGDDARTIETDAGPVGVAICYDSEFPEHGRHLAEQGARLLLVPFCTDVRAAYMRVRHCCAARAIENQCFVALAGSVGTLTGVSNFDIQYSQSAVLTPCDFGFPVDGIAAEASANVEGLVLADLDLAALERARAGGAVRNLADRRPALYRQWT